MASPSDPRGYTPSMAGTGTTMQTFTVNGLAAASPTTLVKAAAVTLRVLVRNIGGPTIFLATADTALSTSTGPTPSSYQLPAGQADVFVVAPAQSLYALVGIVGTGTVCIAVSEALPREV